MQEDFYLEAWHRGSCVSHPHVHYHQQVLWHTSRDVDEESRT